MLVGRDFFWMLLKATVRSNGRRTHPRSSWSIMTSMLSFSCFCLLTGRCCLALTRTASQVCSVISRVCIIPDGNMISTDENSTRLRQIKRHLQPGNTSLRFRCWVESVYFSSLTALAGRPLVDLYVDPAYESPLTPYTPRFSPL
ncbi:hypothetical protein BDW66DRAFT_20276 [Aspergillus desertorum]